MVGPRCVYCGAELDAALQTEAASSAAAQLGSRGAGDGAGLLPAAAEAPGGRSLLVLRVLGLEPGRLASALAEPLFAARQRVRQGGFQLLRVATDEAARAEAARLAAIGIELSALPEDEVRRAARPLVARGGALRDGVLRCRTLEGGEVALGGADVLLVVRGPIHREYQVSESAKRPRLAVPGDGYRLHLHARDVPRPLELDPGGFEFHDERGVASSSLLRLEAFLEALCPAAPQDDGFRRLAPALGEAREEEGGALSATRALRKSSERKDRPLLLDNLRQFRDYSAWRGVLERRRRAG
jgi:hypothetical protein